jgi:CHAT domain-containing protein
LQQLEPLGRAYEALLAGRDPVEPVVQLATDLLAGLSPEELPEIVATVLDVLGSALCVSGDNEAGREVLRQAEELCRSLPEGSADEVKGSVLQHYGNALVNTGHLVEAETVLAEAVTVAYRVGGVAYVEALGNLAVAARAIGDTETQRQLLNQAIDAARFGGMRAQLAVSLNNLGGLYEELGDLEAAERAYAEATATAHELRDRRRAAVFAGNAAGVRRRLGDLAGALSDYASAYAVAAEIGDLNTVVYCLVGAAEALVDSDPAQAESLLREAVDQSGPARPTRKWSALRGLAALVAPRDPAEALALLGDAVALGEYVRQSVTTPDQVPRWQKRLATAYGDMADLLLRQGDTEAAFDQVEKAKAALLVRSLGAAEDTEARPADRIRQALAAAGTSAVLVSYHLHDGTLTTYVLRADDGVLRVERSPLLPADLVGAVATAERELGRPPGARPVETWTRLATALVDPVLPHLRDGDVLLFSPHGPLHRLPLHALPAAGRRVIERWPVAYLPSGSALPAILQRADRPSARRCVIGAHFVEEAEEVARILAADTLTVDADSRTTKDDMLAALSAYDIVHVSAHGYHVPSRPRASGLLLEDRPAVRRYLRLVQAPVHTLSPADRQQLPELRDLAEGSLITAWEIEQTRTGARLVSLSACSSGLAYVDESDDPVGLVPALFRAGSAGVLATLWLVDAASARRLSSDFYRHMLAAPGGWGVAAQELRRATLDEMAQNAHPFYWAAFVLMGGVAPGDAAPWEDHPC